MISIIIPIYNAEKYLNECLDSVQKQIYKDFEVLLINDGSIDGSAKICQKYVNSDSRFKLICISNHGVCYSHNLGLNKARGEYIAFVDSDDRIDNDFLQLLYDNIVQYNADVAVCDFYDENGVKSPDWENNVFRNTEIISAYLNNKFYNRIMNKLYKRDVLDRIMFPVERPILEDAYWTALVLNRCSCVHLSAVGKYYYRITEGSLSHRKLSEAEKVGSYRNLIEKYIILGEKINEKEIPVLVETIMQRLPWMLLSGTDLRMYDTYERLQTLICADSLQYITNQEFEIVRSNDESREAQKSYLKLVMKKRKISLKERLKYLYRFFRYSGM